MENALTVVLLAGGESTRFWPLTEKNSTSFIGTSLLAWHFLQLKKLHTTNVIVVTNETNKVSLEATSVPHGVHVSYVTQKVSGQGNAVLACVKLLKKEPILILNASDFYTDSFLSSLYRSVENAGADMILGAVKVDSYFPGGYVRMNADEYIKEIIEKPEPGKEPSNIVRIMADYIPDAEVFVTAMKQHGLDPTCGYENTLNELIRSGVRCKAEITSVSSWKHLKYPWDVLSMMEEFLTHIEGQQIDKSAVIKPNVIIEGNVVIEAGVKIFEGTKIVGPVFIGKNTIIGNNNIIRSSMIGSDCVTGFNTDITRSYIGNNCWFHSNYIGDSILGNDVSMGSGSVLANLRLDDGEITSVVKEQKIQTGRNKLGSMIGSHVRIGVNVSSMPGIKIGTGTFVGAGVILGNDLKDNQYCVAATATNIIKDNTSKATVSRDGFRKGL